MKKPAERDCLAIVPGYSGAAARLFLARDAAGRVSGVLVFDLQERLKAQGDARSAAEWVGQWLAQESGNRKARRTRLEAQLFACRHAGSDQVSFEQAQQALKTVLAAAEVRCRRVAATSGAARRPIGPKAGKA